MPLDDTDLARVAEVVRMTLAEPRQSDAILTRAEAMVYTKNASAPAFDRWTKRCRVKSITNGRYSRRQLDLGLAREGKTVRFRRQRRGRLKTAA